MHNDDNRLSRLYSTAPEKALTTLLNDLKLSESLMATLALAMQGRTSHAGPDAAATFITNRLTGSVMELEALVNTFNTGGQNAD